MSVVVDGDAEPTLVRRVVRDVFRLDEDLSPLYGVLRRDADRNWAVRYGAGRMMRSPTAFEDLVKLLFTTNCTWGATKRMVINLIDALGAPAPGGRRAFPRPDAMAQKAPAFFRDRVRAGYRHKAVSELSRSIANGSLDAEGWRTRADGEDVHDRILALNGFGPYAAGHMMRLLGRYEALCIDSWVRAKLARMAGRKKPPTDQTIEKRYRKYGEWAGMVLWLDVTKDWHV